MASPDTRCGNGELLGHDLRPAPGSEARADEAPPGRSGLWRSRGPRHVNMPAHRGDLVSMRDGKHHAQAGRWARQLDLAGTPWRRQRQRLAGLACGWGRRRPGAQACGKPRRRTLNASWPRSGRLSGAKNVDGIVPLLDQDLHFRATAGPRWDVMPLAEPAQKALDGADAVGVVKAFVPLARTLAELQIPRTRQIVRLSAGVSAFQ